MYPYCSEIELYQRTTAPTLAEFHFSYEATLKTIPAAITHAVWMNCKPTYPTSLTTFHPWCCRQFLRICFFVFEYMCNMLMHTFRTFCRKIYCKHIRRNFELIFCIKQNHHTAHMSFAEIALAFYFFNSNSEGKDGVQLGSLGISANNWPLVPTPGDYEDGEFGGMVIGKGNRSTRRKSVPVQLWPPQIPHDLKGLETGPPRWKSSDLPLELWQGLCLM
jgi:hypothetical protein